MLFHFLAHLVVAQSGHMDTNMVYYDSASLNSDNASFYVEGSFNINSFSSGPSGGAIEQGEDESDSSYVFTNLSMGYATDNVGSGGYSVPTQFSLCGTYSGALSGRPTSVVYSVGKLENSTGYVTNGNSASSSTTNSSWPSGTNSFSNSVSGTLTLSGWQQQADGSYAFNSYIFSNTLAVNAANRNGNGYPNLAAASSRVDWKLSSVTATH